MARIVVDGTEHEVAEGQNLLAALLGLGADLPYFCWHHDLGSVGACRQCAIRLFAGEEDRTGRIVMACMTPAVDGARVSVDDPEARAFRARVIEWMMTSHPHDCPVCDEGGECHLQDMTVMTGHSSRRYRFDKRTHRNQYLGPFVRHEMNRCIACYRCVRFYRDYAGGRDLAVLSSSRRVYFGRHASGVLESPFAGNLVEVCPTGVFTDRPLARRYTRKWDLQSAPSICVHCGHGCNISAGERYGSLRRVLNRWNGAVNGSFLCDRGRFGHEFVSSPRRTRRPTLGRGTDRRAEPLRGALVEAGVMLLGCETVVGIGSPRASLEAGFALRRLVGEERFAAGHSERGGRLAAAAIRALRTAAPAATLRDLEDADAVLVLGEDVTAMAPRAALALRQAARQRSYELAARAGVPRWHDAAVRNVGDGERSPFVVVSPFATALDDLATRLLRAAPARAARLARAVAAALAGARSGPEGLPEEDRELAELAANELGRAERPLVVSGAGAGSLALLAATASIAAALRRNGRAARLLLLAEECNSVGAAMLGGVGLEHALALLRGGGKTGLVVVENDLFRRASRARVDEALEAAAVVVAVDHLESETTRRADVVLPAATFAEASGTLVNAEGRAQRHFRVLPPEPGGEAPVESWRLVAALGERLGRSRDLPWGSLDEVLADLSGELPPLAGAREAAPGRDERPAGFAVPRQSSRFSGRTASHADRSVHEPQPQPPDPDGPLAFTMEGHPGKVPLAVEPRTWAPGWNSAQAIVKRGLPADRSPARLDSGRRLLEPGEGEGLEGAPEPDGEGPEAGALLVVPAHHVFGSEELSALSGPVAALSPGPSLALHPEDAADRGLELGRTVVLEVAAVELRVPLRLEPALARGVAALAVGLPGAPYLELPAPGRLRRQP